MNSNLASNWMAQAIVLQALDEVRNEKMALSKNLPVFQRELILISVLRHLLRQEAEMERLRSPEPPMIRAYCSCCMKERQGIWVGHVGGWLCPKCGAFILIDLWAQAF